MGIIRIEGEAGRIDFIPSGISPRKIEKIEKELKRLVSSSANDMTAAEMRTLLKKRDPLIGTPGGTLRAYRSRLELTQHALALKAEIKQSHLSEMEQNKRPIGVKVAKRLGKVLKCDYRRLL
jgi:DNA-binding XRE family transcriptional regulator